jgi:hypothetical protein
LNIFHLITFDIYFCACCLWRAKSNLTHEQAKSESIVVARLHHLGGELELRGLRERGLEVAAQEQVGVDAEVQLGLLQHELRAETHLRCTGVVNS